MSLRYLISTEPMDKDWLVAELYADNEPFAELWEGGERIIFFPRKDGQSWNIPLDEFLNITKQARERVRFIPNNE
jgi:hypothetical protein